MAINRGGSPWFTKWRNTSQPFNRRATANMHTAAAKKASKLAISRLSGPNQLSIHSEKRAIASAGKQHHRTWAKLTARCLNPAQSPGDKRIQHARHQAAEEGFKKESHGPVLV